MTTAPYTGFLIQGPVEGTLVTCESPRIPVLSTTELILDGGIKSQVVRGSYIWSSEKEGYVWNLESVAFPERHVEI